MAGNNSIQFVRGTSSQRASHTETSLAGQPIYETDTNKLYVGDGETSVNDLTAVKASAADRAGIADNVKSQINGKNITDIFESNGTTVKWATKATQDALGHTITSRYATKAEATRTATYTQQGQVKMGSTTNGGLITTGSGDDVVPTIKNICDWTKENFLRTTNMGGMTPGTSGKLTLPGVGWYVILFSNRDGYWYNPGIIYHNGETQCLPLCMYRFSTNMGYARLPEIRSDNTFHVYEVSIINAGDSSTFAPGNDVEMDVLYQNLA